MRIHVSADERYDLYLDGIRIGCGSERGDRNNWYFETYDLEMEAGPHVLVARVWSFGLLRPWAQTTVHPGFICSPEGEQNFARLATGTANWRARALNGYEFRSPTEEINEAVGSGPCVRVDGTKQDWNWPNTYAGAGDIESLHAGNNDFYLLSLAPVHLMKPAELPPMLQSPIRKLHVSYVGTAQDGPDQLEKTAIRAIDDLADEHANWLQLIQHGIALTLQPHSSRRILIDLDDYYCFYPELQVSGGQSGQIRIACSEALFDRPVHNKSLKTDRDVTEGKYMVAARDHFELDGGVHRQYDTLWWRAGRYIEVIIRTEGEALTIERLSFEETRYPLTVESKIDLTDPQAESLYKVSLRSLQSCMHETYMDCPYYEQLMYVGDTRLQALLTYVLSADTRLPKKAIRSFDSSRLNFSGFTTDSYPSAHGKLIPPFSLWWIAMCYDFALWRGDVCFIRELMPGVRSVLDRFGSLRNLEGLIHSPNGWNFVDASWPGGVPPGGENGISGPINWQYVIALRYAEILEDYIGEPELLHRWARLRRQTADAITATFWNTKKGIFSDDIEQTAFSEHSQCLAILSGELPIEVRKQAVDGLCTDPSLLRTSAYFTHYLFEVYQEIGRLDLIQNRLAPWYEAIGLGFKTLPEHFGDTRSDCHAWSAHPLYHMITTYLGVRPSALAFEKVSIKPLITPGNRWTGEIIHPRGRIIIDLDCSDRQLRAEIGLPSGVTGAYEFAGQVIDLSPGMQVISVPILS